VATLQDIIDEQTRIAAQLQRMNDNPDTTEDADADLRDTLIARWKELEPRRTKLVADMDDIQAITRAAADPANRESGDGGGQVARMTGSGGPEFMVRKDPLADREETQDYRFLSGDDVIARAGTLVEQHDRKGWLPDHRGEQATESARIPSVARHMLLYGGDEYYDAFRDYVNDPTGPGLQRAAGALSLAAAQGGYLLPYFLDQKVA
jgi:hypothetical protein